MKFLVYILVLWGPISIFGQENYYLFQDDIYNEDSFKQKLSSIEDIYSKQGNFKYTMANYKVRSTAVRADSIIQNVEVFLSQSNSSPLDINTGVQRLLNTPLPDFQLQNLDSNLKSNKDYEGKVTLVNLWFTSCAPCITEIPYLNYLKGSYGEKVHFVAMTFDNKEKVKGFLSRRPFHFEQLVDATQYLSKELNNNAFPKLIILDKSGTIRFVENGVMLAGNLPSQPEVAVTTLKQQIDLLLSED